MPGTKGHSGGARQNAGRKASPARIERLEPILQQIDERLSTVQASRQLQESGKNARQQRGRIDSEAACVLLQGYLDSRTDFPLLPPDA